jgi:hypothetical protein
MAWALAVVHAHDVIRVSMGDQDGIHHPNPFPETLKSHLGCGVDEQADAVGFDKDGWARSMVLGVGKECLRIGGADHRYSHGGSGTQNHHSQAGMTRLDLSHASFLLAGR